MARDPNKVLLLALLVLMAAFLTGTAVAAAPTNDAFDAATELSGREASASGTNKDATKEAGEPAHAGKTGGASVWYRWTAPASGKATVRNRDHPKIASTAPPRAATNAIRDRNAPPPRAGTSALAPITTRPARAGRAVAARNRSRRSHARKAAIGGIRKPCE